MTEVVNKRVDIIREKLSTALNPDFLDIIDEGALHKGHAGAQTGLGHFAIIIKSPELVGKSKVQQHRLIYAALGDLMETDIHAVRIEIQN